MAHSYCSLWDLWNEYSQNADSKRLTEPFLDRPVSRHRLWTSSLLNAMNAQVLLGEDPVKTQPISRSARHLFHHVSPAGSWPFHQVDKDTTRWSLTLSGILREHKVLHHFSSSSHAESHIKPVLFTCSIHVASAFVRGMRWRSGSERTPWLQEVTQTIFPPKPTELVIHILLGVDDYVHLTFETFR